MIYFHNQNVSGNMSHYYHYMFGFLLPNALLIKSNPEIRIFKTATCGPMNRLTNEVFGRKALIQEPFPTVAADLLSESFKLNKCDLSVIKTPSCDRHIIINGWDHPSRYNNKYLRLAADFIYEQLQENSSPSNKINYQKKNSALIIDRDSGDPYYPKKKTKKGGNLPDSGATRRSIPNIHAVAHAVRQHFEEVKVVRLEKFSLLEQVTLVKQAKIIIAQHGAALSNIIWANPSCSIIEIMPREIYNQAQGHGIYFKALAQELGLHYAVVNQDSEHARVEPRLVTNALPKLRS